MTDRTTKFIFTVIALGLWANVTIQMFQPSPAFAQEDRMFYIERHLRNIQGSVNSIMSDVGVLAVGTCKNKKICE